jgi:hypothetical protein
MADEGKAKKTTQQRTSDLKDAFAALRSVPATGTPDAGTPGSAGQRQRPAGRRTGTRTTAARTRTKTAVEQMPAEQDKPPSVWDARINLTLSREMKKALDLARAEDGLELTARIRAMITLWQEDERLARKVNDLAKSLR